jgi:guanosine-3',5'-bis(diphosphate) 3'-pyrophosphohydrolase
MNEEMVARAKSLAEKAHAGAKRRNGDPYITHPIRVAASFSEWSWRERVVSLLHDTVEDTYVTLEDIERDFGSGIAADVDALTRRKGENYLQFILRA